MPRVIVAQGCREVDGVSGTRYYARGGERGYKQGGLFDMSSGDARAAVAIGGAIASESGTTRKGLGYRCKCGFGSFLRTCGRCGGQCEREAS